MAEVSGLSRMHFAAQFRTRTGLSPMKFLMRRRIERAQELLLLPRSKILDVAFDVGFKNQAHFTMAFSRVAGETPHRWRKANQEIEQ